MMEPNVPESVGEIEAGRAAKVRREINKLIKATNSSEFDIAELLYETKSRHYYSPDFESYSKYAKSLNIKYTRAYYYVKVIENMLAADLKRAQYESVGMTKLRVISRLEPAGEYKGIPMPLVIRELTLKAEPMTMEELVHEVETILGLTEDESMVWMNIKLKKLARENAVKPALALMKKHMPESQKKDEEGNYKDPSDGAALEMLCANTLSDPNFNTEYPTKVCSHCGAVTADLSAEPNDPATEPNPSNETAEVNDDPQDQ